MFTVINAWNQRGWSSRGDHMLNDDKLTDMVGRQYTTLRGLKAAASRRATSYPTVEYEFRGRRFRYDGSPTCIPGRHVQVITELDHEEEEPRW